MDNQIRVRIAPSPTGYPHIGTIYQAMFDFAFARKYQGRFIVRIEDTDRERFVKDAEQVIYDSLAWFGLTPDEDPVKGGPYAPYRQSERLDIYKKYVEILIANSHAYYCFCTKDRLDAMRKQQEAEKKPPRYDRTCRHLSPEEIQNKLANGIARVVRMKTPDDQAIVVRDAIVGDVTFDSNLIDDQVLMKSDGFPTYHLAVVIDDYLMKITHVFRGTEWLSSSPKHVLLYQFFGWQDQIPVFIHLPLILNSDAPGKLSKRNGHASVDFYREKGYLPEAILNYLANIVWNHPEGKEIYPFEDFGKAFDIHAPRIIDVTSTGAKFDLKKLDWINGEYIKKLSDDDLAQRLQPFVSNAQYDYLLTILPLARERIKKLSDISEFSFFFTEPEYDTELLRWKERTSADIVASLRRTESILNDFDWNNFNSEQFRSQLDALAQEIGERGLVYWPLRVALSGLKASPDPVDITRILGEERTLYRIRSAIEKLTH